MTETVIKNGQTILLKIKCLGIDGEGIDYFRRLTIFVPCTLPKEGILVKITKAAPHYVEGEPIEVKKPSEDRVVTPYPVYYEYGGCRLQYLAYQTQLNLKKGLLLQTLGKFKSAGFQSYQLLPAVGTDDPWHCRNKAQPQLRKNRQTQKTEAGLHEINSHQLVPITDCLVQEPRT